MALQSFPAAVTPAPPFAIQVYCCKVDLQPILMHFNRDHLIARPPEIQITSPSI